MEAEERANAVSGKNQVKNRRDLVLLLSLTNMSKESTCLRQERSSKTKSKQCRAVQGQHVLVCERKEKIKLFLIFFSLPPRPPAKDNASDNETPGIHFRVIFIPPTPLLKHLPVSLSVVYLLHNFSHALWNLSSQEIKMSPYERWAQHLTVPHIPCLNSSRSCI